MPPVSATCAAEASPVRSRRAVFLDRDGTLNLERNYLSDPEQLELFPGSGEALRRIMDSGYLLFIVTNQSGIGRGYYTEADLHAVNRRLVERLASQGIRFERIYFAPEAPEQPSRGRKPSPQFLFDARDEFGLDLAQCFMVGDKIADVECGWNAGVKASVLVRTGYGAETELKHGQRLEAAWVLDGLAEFAERLAKA
jgi:D-glycero-D-manno-heptose 1,7-bisphosphate phosphatase